MNPMVRHQKQAQAKQNGQKKSHHMKNLAPDVEAKTYESETSEMVALNQILKSGRSFPFARLKNFLLNFFALWVRSSMNLVFES